MKNYKSFLAFIVFFTAGFYLLDQKINIPFFSATGVSLIIFGVWWTWDKYLWKTKHFFLPYLANIAGLHNYPDLSGKWEATYSSSYNYDLESDRYVTTGDGEVEIKQTYSTIFIDARFGESDSESFVANLKQKENGNWFLIYGYRNKPKSEVLQNSPSGGMHEGFCYLELKDDQLDGYYTNDENRKTRGKLTLSRR